MSEKDSILALIAAGEKFNIALVWDIVSSKEISILISSIINIGGGYIILGVHKPKSTLLNSLSSLLLGQDFTGKIGIPSHRSKQIEE